MSISRNINKYINYSVDYYAAGKNEQAFAIYNHMENLFSFIKI